jgi:MFS family permease
MVLSARSIDRALRFSVWEGVAWALMVGLGETYFVADAVRLGATPLELALTVTLPLALGGFGPLLGLTVLRRRARRKPLVVSAILLQAAVLAGMTVLEIQHRFSASLLIAAVCVYQITGQTAGTGWSSWFGDLVPTERRGRYFARRNRAVYGATCAGILLGGTILGALEPSRAAAAVEGSGGRGFALMFALAVLFRIASAALFSLTPEPSFRGLANREHVTRFLGSERGARALRLILVGVVFHFTVYLSSPYFAPYMLEALRFSYVQYMGASVFVILCKAAAAAWWGGAVDRHGPRRIFAVAMVLVAIVPLPWLFARGLAVVLAAQALSGGSWSAYELSYFTLLLDSSTRRTRPPLFAAQSLLLGWSQLAAGVLAASMLERLGGDFRALFGLSAALRLGVAAAAPGFITWTAPITPVQARRIALRALGIRPSGGLAQRPVYDAEERDDPAR